MLHLPTLRFCATSLASCKAETLVLPNGRFKLTRMHETKAFEIVAWDGEERLVATCHKTDQGSGHTPNRCRCSVLTRPVGLATRCIGLTQNPQPAFDDKRLLSSAATGCVAHLPAVHLGLRYTSWIAKSAKYCRVRLNASPEEAA